uniref:Pentatricopeptide repeat-containing protein n=1 Tax=Cannabis sativa TaxID=3483 RepID=A0A803NYX9_CANSA
MSSLCRRVRAIFTRVPSKPSANFCTTETLGNKRLVKNTSASTTETQLQKLVDEFKKSSKSSRFRHNQSIYRRTVARLAGAKKFSMIEDILEDQKQYYNISSQGFAMRLISLYGQSGMFDHAQKVFDELPELNCPRTVSSFNALLKAGVASKKYDKVVEIFKELPSRVSIEPDLVSYNIVIKALCEMGSLDDALSMFHELDNIGKEPDLVTFNTILNVLYRNGQFSEGDKIWAMMESKNVVPDVRSYNTKLRGMVLDGRVSEAVQLMDEMKSKHIIPDVFSYNALLKGFCDGKNLEEAKTWYGQLQESECNPDLVTYQMLIPLFFEADDFDMAFELCSEAINQEMRLKKEMFTQVVNGLVKQDKDEKACKLVELINSTKYLKYKLELPVVD